MKDRKHLPKDYIKRPVYSNRIMPFVDKQIIKVITGQRRVGKSYIMYQIVDEILGTNPKANIIFINKELKEFDFIKTEHDLYGYIHQLLQPRVSNYVFVDEIQDIYKFEKAFRSLLAESCCDLFCTGSNANLLSGELATLLAGRYIEIKVHSLDYDEFLNFMDLKVGNDSLVKYFELGGMPYLRVIGANKEDAYEYLKNVYSSILLKDVIARENIRNVYFLENLVSFLADNTGNMFSANNISKYLKAQHITVTTQTVVNYLKPLTNANFIYKMQRYDLKGLKIFETGAKYYFEDIGLRNSIVGFELQKDIQKIMENAVFHHLLRHQYKLYVGKIGESEIDFVAERRGSKIYIQVAYLLRQQSTINREFGNLLKISDNYPKYVVTMDEYNSGTNYRGITQMHIGDFLLKDL